MAPENLLLLIIVVALVAYALLGGADFGAGVWEFNTALKSEPDEKQLIYHAIGPVWEANHVWLIFVLVGLFSGFPLAFAAMCQALFFPLLFALCGIVFRGAAYAFRSYTPALKDVFWWELAFAIASVAAPFFLGVAVGALAKGHLEVTPSGDFLGSYWTAWVSPFSLLCGFLAVGICAYLAAIYLARESHQLQKDRLTQRWRQRAIRMGLITGALSLATLTVGLTSSEHLRHGFSERAWPMIGLSVFAGLVSLVALQRRRYNWATLGGAGTVSTVLLGWGVAQFPDLIPGAISIADAKAPTNVLWSYLIAIACGLVMLVPSLGLLFYLFKSKPSSPAV